MCSKADTARWPRAMGALAGLLASLAGLSVLAGWILHVDALVQIAPGIAPVHFNSGLGLLLGGLALSLVSLGRTRAAVAPAVLTFLIGGVTGLEYLAQVPHGIDEVFHASQIASGAAVPGRMAPATALSLAFHGVGVLLLAVGGPRKALGLPAALMGSASAVLGVNGLLGYATGIEEAYRWGGYIEMAPQTTVALVALGIGLLLAAWARAALPRGSLPGWLAPVATLDALAAVLALWLASSNEQRTILARAATQQTAGIATELAGEMASRGELLEAMARRWRALGRPSGQEWESEALLLVGSIGSARSLGWYGTDGHLKRHVGPVDGADDVGRFDEVARAIRKAARVGKVVASDGFELGLGGPAVALAAPVAVGGRPDGALVWVLFAPTLFGQELGRDVESGYGVRVQDGRGLAIYENDPGGLLRRVDAPARDFAVPGGAWSVRAWPVGTVAPLLRSDLPTAMAVGGSFFALLIGLAIALGGRSARTAAALRYEVHERERVQAALAESERLFRSVFDHAAVGIGRADSAGVLLGCNPAFAGAMGYTREELTGRNFAEITHPADLERNVDLYAQLVAGERDDFVIEKRFLRKGGGVFWGRLTASAVRDERGRHLWSIGLLENVTERRRAEGQLRTLNRRLAERNSDLERFASVVAHDLQEPLLTVRMFAEHLAEDHATGLDLEGRDYLGRIRRAATHMQGLIESLLALTRVATRGAPFAPVDLGLVATEVVADLSARIEAAGGEVIVDEDLPIVEADASQMHQLFQNLVSNALKFHRAGVPPRVHISSRPLKAEEGSGGRRILVADNGVGFGEHDVERIFEPFQRLQGRSGYEGTGIGLAICRRIVQRHGGTIRAESERGRGTTFEIRLPVVQPVGREREAALEARGDGRAVGA